jgi:tetratricopeptide (TPR) repeat protein
MRESVWADSLTLWKDAEAKSPELARPRLNLGMAYQTEGSNDLAMIEYEHALRVNPRLALAYINIAGIYFGRDDFEDSEKALKKAMDMAPTLPAITLASDTATPGVANVSVYTPEAGTTNSLPFKIIAP